MLVFVALLILYISRRKKQPRRRNGKLPLPSHHRPEQNPRGNNSRGGHLESGKKRIGTGDFRMSGL